MTREASLFTNSQQEAIFQECLQDDFDLNFEGLSQNLSNFSSQEFKTLNQENAEEGCSHYPSQPILTVPSHMIDNKMLIQSSLNLLPNPMSTPILGKDEFPGDYNFKLILNHQNPGKHWVYSEKLKKVFIHMEQVLPLHFQWYPPLDELWVRATMVYKDDNHRSQPVTRCPNHEAPNNNGNTDPRQIKHVIRCRHNTSNYEQDSNGHLSVLTPLGTPEPGMAYVPMDFLFYCKNSCTNGMNRRATELILTLENNMSQILGRQKLEIRVCSCPKRDKEKEEKEDDSELLFSGNGKKKKLKTSVSAPPPGKRIANQPTDTQIYPLHLNALGRDNAQAIIKFAYDLHAGCAARSSNHDLYKPFLDDIAKKMF